MINQLDTQAFLWLNSLHIDYFDPIMLWITGRNSWFPMYGILIGSIVWLQKRKSIGVLLMIIFSIIISDQICSSILKPLVHRLRPCHEPTIQNIVHIVGNCGGQFGFCSSHAANTFALVTCLLLLFGKQINGLKYLYIWAIIVSYSRIYVGVHYPLDVLSGAGIGVLSSLFCNKIYHYYLSKFTNENI
jgi:undecaprenyl-diphosphatase